MRRVSLQILAAVITIPIWFATWFAICLVLGVTFALLDSPDPMNLLTGGIAGWWAADITNPIEKWLCRRFNV